MFNALKYIKSLEAVGFQREQAEAQVQLVYETLGEEVANKSDISMIQSEMATKGDMVEVKSDVTQLKTDMTQVKSDVAQLKTDMAQVKSDVAQLKTDMSHVEVEITQMKSEMATKSDLSELKAEILYKLGGLMLASMTAITAILGILIKF